MYASEQSRSAIRGIPVLSVPTELVATNVLRTTSAHAIRTVSSGDRAQRELRSFEHLKAARYDYESEYHPASFADRRHNDFGRAAVIELYRRHLFDRHRIARTLRRWRSSPEVD